MVIAMRLSPAGLDLILRDKPSPSKFDLSCYRSNHTPLLAISPDDAFAKTPAHFRQFSDEKDYSQEHDNEELGRSETNEAAAYVKVPVASGHDGGKHSGQCHQYRPAQYAARASWRRSE